MIDWVALELRVTSPKPMLVAFMVSVGTEALSCRATFFETPPEAAVSVAVWLLATAEMTAENPVLVAPAGTVTEAGTTTALLLLVRVTVDPPLGAAAVRVAVQGSVIEPVMDRLVQETALRAGWIATSCRANVFETPPAVAVSDAV